MHVLALDTSTSVGSVALVSDGRLVAELSAGVRARHGEVLLPHVERILGLGGLSFAEVDLIAVGLGPGSFTGLRIGVATAKGLALSRGKPLIGVTSLRVLGRGLLAAGVAVPVVDAHRGEVYAAAYRGDGAGPVEELLAPMHALPEEAARRVRDATGPDARLVLCGDGVRKYGEAFCDALEAPHVIASDVLDVPRASLLALEAMERYARDGASDLATLEPIYVRPSDAKLPKRSLRID